MEIIYNENAINCRTYLQNWNSIIHFKILVKNGAINILKISYCRLITKLKTHDFIDLLKCLFNFFGWGDWDRTSA